MRKSTRQIHSGEWTETTVSGDGDSSTQPQASGQEHHECLWTCERSGEEDGLPGSIGTCMHIDEPVSRGFLGRHP